MLDPQEIANRYAALWNETDPEARRRGIADFFAPDAEHYVRTREAKGYAALEQRIIGSHEKNVRDGGYRFRAAPGAQLLRKVVTFNWEMVPASAPDKVVAVGLEFIILGDDCRALTDYQFIIA